MVEIKVAVNESMNNRHVLLKRIKELTVATSGYALPVVLKYEYGGIASVIAKYSLTAFSCQGACNNEKKNQTSSC